MWFVKAVRDSGGQGQAWGRRRARVAGLVCGVTFAASPASAQEPEIPVDYDAAIAQSGMDGSYGYLRALDGSATLIQGDTRERVQITVNEPVLAGDRLFASGESRVEIVLADRNLVRVGDRAELLFRALANSGDTSDPASVLELTRGTLQLLVSADQLGSEFPAVVTPNATIRPRVAGSYLIIVDDERRSEVVVRDGVAEVATETEVAEVRRGESLSVEGSRGDRLDFAAAPSLDRLELWGQGVGEYARGETAAHVDSRSPLRGFFAERARLVGERGRQLRVASARVQRLGTVSGWSMEGHAERAVLGLLRTVGLGPLPLRNLGSALGLGLDLVPRAPFRGGARLLVLGSELRGLDPVGLLLAPLPQPLREPLGFPLRRVRTHRGQLRALPALDLPAARTARASATVLLLGRAAPTSVGGGGRWSAAYC